MTEPTTESPSVEDLATAAADAERIDAERRAAEEAEHERWSKATPEERHEMARAFALRLVAGGDQAAADRVLAHMNRGAFETGRNERRRVIDYLRAVAGRFHPDKTIKARKLIAAIIADLEIK